MLKYLMLTTAFLFGLGLSPTTYSAPGEVVDDQKISASEGNFNAILDDLDQFGNGLDSIGDLDGDGIDELMVSAPNDDDGGQNTGAIYVLFMTSTGTVKTSQKISATDGGLNGVLSPGDVLGVATANLGDVNGDGIDDIAVSAGGDDDGGTNRGAVYILFLNDAATGVPGTVKGYQKISSTSSGMAGALIDSIFLGHSGIAQLDDLDGDGIRDLAVGAWNDSSGPGVRRGSIFILFMNGPGSPGTVKGFLKHTVDGIGGVVSDVSFWGAALENVGDLNGDGISDLAVGAEQDDDGGNGKGSLWILFLNDENSPAGIAGAGTVKGFQKISNTSGGLQGALSSVADSFGISATNMGDLDGDGVNELAVGAINDDDGGTNRGAVYILFLNNESSPDGAGTVKAFQKISDLEGNFTGLLDDSDNFGRSVAAIVDPSGQGQPTLAVGAPLDDDGCTLADCENGAFWILTLESAIEPPAAETIQQVIEELQDIISANPNSSLADKLEDAAGSAAIALFELNKTPPDNQAAAGAIEGAVGDLEAAIYEGFDPTEAGTLMNALAGAVRQLAQTALDKAIALGGDPDEIIAAELALANGDDLREVGAFKDSVSSYKEAISKAESAIN